MRSSIAVVFAVACSVVAGCTQPINVQVVDSQSGRPIPGASVERWALERPHFILGLEQRKTDAEGQALLKGRRGTLHATASGYKKGRGGLDTEENRIVVELTPVGTKAAADQLRAPDSALPARPTR